MSEEKIRCFIALDPPMPMIKSCAALQKQLAEHLPEVRMVPEKDLHVTLVFLGDLLPAQVEGMKEAIGAVAVAPMEWRAQQVVLFSKTVIGLELVTEAPAAMLKNELEGMAERAGISLPDRKRTEKPHLFRPHISLGRSKENIRADQVPEIRPDDAHWQMKSITLYRSDLKPSGAEYTPLLSREL